MHTQTELQGQSDWVDLLAQEARALVAELDAHPGARRLFDGTLDEDDYRYYLVQTYHYARWSTPMLADSGERLKRMGWHPRLADLLSQKAAEERGHERWLLSDLKNLGWSAERVEGTEPSQAVKAYVGWNLFTARAGVPTAILGTSYVLEFLSQARATRAVEGILRANAIPNVHKAVTFLKSHGTLDEGHVDELTSVLRTLTDRREQAAVLLSARTTRTLCPGFFRER